MRPTAFVRNYPSENEAINTIWGQSDYYSQTNKQPYLFNMGEKAPLPLSAQPRFQTRDIRRMAATELDL